MVSDRCKARKILKGIIVKPDKELLHFTLKNAVASDFAHSSKKRLEFLELECNSRNQLGKSQMQLFANVERPTNHFLKTN